ncbi:uncharacterized protein V1516DRAFT_683055 [Lipomyces oligophaga]|uniref:uncharacterized protein n=1 Tax=Lipomyces oligophaga TaxID=45792 RepID=UPI0034CE9045
MKYSISLIVLPFLASTAVTAISYSDLPECSWDCAQSAIKTYGCTTVACYCSSDFMNMFGPCAVKACGTSDFDDLAATADSLCSDSTTTMVFESYLDSASATSSVVSSSHAKSVAASTSAKMSTSTVVSMNMTSSARHSRSGASSTEESSAGETSAAESSAAETSAAATSSAGAAVVKMTAKTLGLASFLGGLLCMAF